MRVQTNPEDSVSESGEETDTERILEGKQSQRQQKMRLMGKCPQKQENKAVQRRS